MLPSRHDPIPAKPASLYSQEEAKRIIEQATMDAIKLFANILSDPDADTKEKLSAAKQILDLGHGKQAQELKIVQTQQDAASIVADAIAQARRGHTIEITPDLDAEDVPSAEYPGD